MGRLNLSLYGTRDAAQNWSKEYTRTQTSCGFIIGGASPCNFYHPDRDLVLTVHGDDFIVSGPEEELNWLTATLRSRWDVTVSMLGPDTHQSQEVSILNRSIRWTANGLEYEADQRHVRVVLEQLELQDSKPVTTPFGPQEQGCPRDEGELLCGAEATKFRAIVARLNYLAMDRADIQCATKECAKRMANPGTQTGSY